MMVNRISIDARGIQEADASYEKNLQILCESVETQKLSDEDVNDVVNHIMDLIETAAELAKTENRYPYALFFAITALEECTKALASVDTQGQWCINRSKELREHGFKHRMSVSPSFHTGSRLSADEWKMRYEKIWHKGRTKGFKDERSGSIYFSFQKTGVVTPLKKFSKEYVLNFLLFTTEVVDDNLLSIVTNVDSIMERQERIWREVYSFAAKASEKE